ncbi:MAG TPA: ATP phosphoribosyltransferase regulatory subunit [Ruminiclostridium sp.]|nr:ATP phosphoribosyltransferase regulatory subunit [Ruminiclostridium sp.]
MARYSKMVPEGTCDLLFKECEALREVQNRMTELFKTRGFNEVTTPSIEFYDVFNGKSNAMPQEMMYKLTDSKGRIIALRPDNTMPVMRVATTKLKGFQPPLRLFYNQNVFRISPSLSGRRDEIPQCGIELLGLCGIKADLEVIATAVDALKSVTNEFRIEIGHIGYFKAIIDSLKCSDDEKEQIRIYIESKNYAALTDVLKENNNKAGKALIELPRLFGGEEVLDRAVTISPNDEALETIKYLRSIYDVLCKMGLKDKIIIDLGLVQQIDYYTGVIFRGYVQGSGEYVLSGGRYDTLAESFGTEMAATGFAVNTETISRCVNSGQKTARPDIIIYYNAENAKAAFEHMETLISSGSVCEMSGFETIEETREYAKIRGIARIDTVSETNGCVSIKTETI